MTRKEQILQDNSIPECYVDRERKWVHEAFMYGVDWADEHPLQKSKAFEGMDNTMTREELFQIYLQKREFKEDEKNIGRSRE